MTRRPRTDTEIRAQLRATQDADNKRALSEAIVRSTEELDDESLAEHNAEEAAWERANRPVSDAECGRREDEWYGGAA